MKPVCGPRCLAEVTRRLNVRASDRKLHFASIKTQMIKVRWRRRRNLASKIEHMLHNTLWRQTMKYYGS